MKQSGPSDVRELCLLLGYSRQAYYKGERYNERQSFKAELIVKEVMRYRKDQKRIGTRKLYEELSPFLDKHGFKIGRDVLFKILAQHGLLIRKRKSRKAITTNSYHRFRRYANLIKNYVPVAPNQLWVSDITYIPVGSKYAYLSLITDAYSRKIVGYCLRKDLSAQGPLNALCMALENNPSHTGLIHHSDRGIQYCSDAYTVLLTENGVRISMTQNGDPLENAIAERINGILKDELLLKKYASFKSADARVAVAIDVYNHQRPHGSIDYLKPADAHLQQGTLKRRWKTYYKKATGKEVTQGE